MDIIGNLIAKFIDIIAKTVDSILSAKTVGDLILRLVALIGSYIFFVMPVGRRIFQLWVKIGECYGEVSINFYDCWSLLDISNYLNIIKWILITIFSWVVGIILTVATVVGIILYLALFASIILFFITPS